MNELIDSGSPEAEARDRLAVIGFAEVERRLRIAREALEKVKSDSCQKCHGAGYYLAHTPTIYCTDSLDEME